MVWTRQQPCYDGLGRDRTLTVGVTEQNLVGIYTPPGEFAGLTIVQTALHISHVGEAVIEATRHADGAPGAALDYRQPHGLLDHGGEPRRMVVAAQAGWVNISVAGWSKAEPDDAEQLADSIRAAALVARYQRRI